MNIKFRKAGESDYNEILKLKRESHNRHHNNRPDFYKYSELPLDNKEYQKLLGNNDNDIYVVKSGNNICGYAITKIITFRDDPLIIDHCRFFIDDLYVDLQYRKKGIGKFLMRELVSVCKSKGFRYMDLNVWAFNTEAIDFYKKNGMQEIMIRMEQKIGK